MSDEHTFGQTHHSVPPLPFSLMPLSPVPIKRLYRQAPNWHFHDDFGLQICRGQGSGQVCPSVSLSPLLPDQFPFLIRLLSPQDVEWIVSRQNFSELTFCHDKTFESMHGLCAFFFGFCFPTFVFLDLLSGTLPFHLSGYPAPFSPCLGWRLHVRHPRVPQRPHLLLSPRFHRLPLGTVPHAQPNSETAREGLRRGARAIGSGDQ